MTDLMESPLTPAEEERAETLRSWHNVARGISEWRAARKLTQHELACRAGTKQSRISELESARGNVRFDTLNRVTLALGLEVTLHERQPLPVCTGLEGYIEPKCVHFQNAVDYWSRPHIADKWATWTLMSMNTNTEALFGTSGERYSIRLFLFHEHDLDPFRIVDEMATDDITRMMANIRSRALPALHPANL